jgi:hypothetical protein
MKRRAADVMEKLAEELGHDVCPLELLIRIANSESQPWDMRADAAKAALPYLYPKLSALQVTGKDEGPIELAAIERMRENPEMVRQAELLAFGMLQGGGPAGLLPAASL